MHSDLLARFAAIVGDRHALTDSRDVEPYISEPRGLYGGRTPLVLRPGSVEEVSKILALATQTVTPIVPQGGNTGLVGGQMPDRSGGQIVLSLSRLNRIREMDLGSNTVIAEAGVVLETLQNAADAADRLFPLALASQGSCEIGGNLSSNAGGVGALSYGVARDLCLGLEIVLPDGAVLDDLRKLKKDNTGYDLKNLFIGAEGTLGVITAAVLKLFPKPKGKQAAWVALRSPETALELLNRGLAVAGPGLTAFELMERRPLEYLHRHFPEHRLPLGLDAPWQALIEISSGRSQEDARDLAEQMLGTALEAGIISDAVLAENLRENAEFWRLREILPETQKAEGASIKHDISLPVAAIPQFIPLAAAEVERVCAGARVVCFGHMGDGNLHYNVSQPVGMDKAAFLALYRPMNTAVHDVVRALHGSISAEHGIGQLKRDELAATAPAVGIDLMRRIKISFDPAGIMNPGKVI
jgi:FAD/FMN-containing dehydrogenase